MEYRYVATSIEGFIQQLAVAYVQHGYWFYVSGWVPERKDAAAVDRKLLDRYSIGVSPWGRARRKRQGLANLQYLRYDCFFVLIATRGEHDFREREASVIRDIRRAPIHFAGYSIGCRKGVDRRWHASVRVEQDTYLTNKAYLLDIACQRSAASMAAALRRGLSFEPYAPIRRQSLNILRAVNKARATAGMELIPHSCLRFRRRIVQPFGRNVPSQGGALGTSNLS
jgi:hypothetical protein